MKALLKILSILLLIGLLSCNNDEEILPLTPDLVSEIKAYDLDNNGNSSDIRLSFRVKDNLNVFEYRIMFVPSSASNSFNEGIAASTPSTGYLRIEPESFKTEHSIRRLPESLLDVNGAQIQNDKEYVIAVLVIGNGNQQLSEYSNPIELKDQPIFNGRYWIGNYAKCIFIHDPDAPPGPDINEPPSPEAFIDLFSAEGSEYSGTITWGWKGSISYKVVGTTFLNYIYDAPEHLCPDLILCSNPCPLIEQGVEGVIIDELRLEISYQREDCLLTCEGTRVFLREG